MFQTVYIIDSSERSAILPVEFNEDDPDLWLLPITHIDGLALRLFEADRVSSHIPETAN